MGGGAGVKGLSVLPQRKMQKLSRYGHSITLRFGHEDLVKTKLFIEVHAKNEGKAFYYNFKIFQEEEELELPKVQLKSENQKIILHKTDHNLLKIALF